MHSKEEVVAVVQPVVQIAGEEELTEQVNSIEYKAESMVIKDDEAYKAAGVFGRTLKQKAADVMEFFKPMKDSAYKAHREICEREKSMLTPLKNAEQILKKAMSVYTMEIEKRRREEEERLRKIAEEEARRKLEEAVKLEAMGEKQAAESAMLDAQFTEQIGRSVTIHAEKPQAEGVSTSVDWEIADINANEVPLSVAGVLIRPVDVAAVMKLIRASKGTIQIPGITYKKIAKMSFRR